MLASALTHCRVGRCLFICQLTCWLRQEGSKRSGVSSIGQEAQMQPADVSKLSCSHWHSFRKRTPLLKKKKNNLLTKLSVVALYAAFAFVFMASTVFLSPRTNIWTGETIRKTDKWIQHKFSSGCQNHLVIVTHDWPSELWFRSVGSHKLSWNHQTSPLFISAKVENKEVGVWVIILLVTPKQKALALWGWHAKICIKQNPHMLHYCPTCSGPSGWTQMW